MCPPPVGVRENKFNTTLRFEPPPNCGAVDLSGLEERFRVLEKVAKEIGINLIQRDAPRERLHDDIVSRTHGCGMEMKLEVLGKLPLLILCLVLYAS